MKEPNMPDQKDSILVVDDAPDTLEILSRNLADNGYLVFTSSNVPDAVRLLDSEKIDLVITDLKMPKVSGMDLVRHVRDNFSDTEVMMITGYATVEGAVEAVKTGAEEYLTKPFTDDELLSAVQRVLEKLRQYIDNKGTQVLLSEKVFLTDSKLQTLIHRLHIQEKRKGFTDAEILDKDNQLSVSMFCKTERELDGELKKIGSPTKVWQSYNFMGYVVNKYI